VVSPTVDDTQPSAARAWVGCALVVLGAVVLIAGLLVLDTGATGWLAAVVAPAVVLVTAGAVVLRYACGAPLTQRP
jgi:hypothetical protein